MTLHILTDNNSIANNLIAELRDKNIQQDRLRFRWNMERLGEIMAYEISKQFHFDSISIETPLGSSKMRIIQQPPYIITILRAGIPFFQGFINIFNHAESGFIGAFRSGQGDQNQFDIKMGYTAIGEIDKRNIILVDPMIATGRSVLKAIDHILLYGLPKKIFIAALIGSKVGYGLLQEHIKIPVECWFGDMDVQLDKKFFIVPGLGDAGDLCFGEKL